MIAVGTKSAGPKDMANFVNACMTLYTTDTNFRTLLAQNFKRQRPTWGAEEEQVLKKALVIFQKNRAARARSSERDWTVPLFNELNHLVGPEAKRAKTAVVDEPRKHGEPGKENQSPQGMQQKGGNYHPQPHNLPLQSMQSMQPRAQHSPPTRGSAAGSSSSTKPSTGAMGAGSSPGSSFRHPDPRSRGSSQSPQNQSPREMASRPARPTSSNMKGVRPCEKMDPRGNIRQGAPSRP